MWHRDTKWTNAVGKMTLVDLLNTGLPQLVKKSAMSVKYDKAKYNNTKYAYISFFQRTLSS